MDAHGPLIEEPLPVGVVTMSLIYDESHSQKCLNFALLRWCHTAPVAPFAAESASTHAAIANDPI